MERFPITKEGLAKMEDELKNLKFVERPKIIQAISDARALGDLSENAEYHSAKEKQSFLEGRVQELEAKISYAEVIDTSGFTGKVIKFGATVSLIDEETEEERSYRVLGEYEADISKSIISISSPIARAMIGKTEGDSIEVNTPKGIRTYEIVKVSYN